ncbi:MAG: hypothetical protein EBR81_01185 [Proteobacteria bacterium]|nr:hypothetical protein [Pseudomonadota bacterium]
MNLNFPALPEPTGPDFQWFHGLRFPKIPANRTLRWALCLLLGCTALQLTFLFFSPSAPADASANSLAQSNETTSSLSPSMLIEPRLGAPTLRSAWQDLLEQSRAAGAKGEMENAIRLLELAESQVPQQPAALADIAIQMERCAPPERAINLWSRVHQFGVSAGVYYAAADAKLRLLNTKTTDAASASNKSDASTNSGPLRFGKFISKEIQGSLPERRLFTLSVPVKKIVSEAVQVKDVSIQVQFYDQVNGRMLERTNASLRWKWASAPVDWLDDSIETLNVDYRQSPGGGEDRRYFGYVASVYYQDKLLDSRADPVRLGQQYPPPRLLTRETAP